MKSDSKPGGTSGHPGLTASEKIRLRVQQAEFRQLPWRLRQLAVSRLPDPFERSAMLPDGRTLCFIHVPKTGGTSLASALGLRNGHIPLSRYLARDPERLAAAYTFAFVRNPWTRLFSSYNYLKAAIGINNSPDVRWATETLQGYSGFEDFVLALADRSVRRRIFRWPHFRAQMDWIALPGSDRPQVDFLGRFETLDDDTQELAARLGADVSLPHLRKAKAYAETPVFTREMIEIIADCYSRDIRALDYRPPETLHG